MPEDIIDFHLHDGVEVPEPASEPVNEAKTPSYVTREDLQAFGEALAASLKPTTPEVTLDWEAQFTNRAADTATQRLLDLNKPIFAAQIADQVAGEYGPEVRAEILEELRSLSGTVIAGITQSPADLRKLARMARGIHAEKHGSSAPTSRGAGTVNPATVAENDEADRYFQAYKDIGVTKEMAKRWAARS
jgi:hypothetical protein